MQIEISIHWSPHTSCKHDAMIMPEIIKHGVSPYKQFHINACRNVSSSFYALRHSNGGWHRYKARNNGMHPNQPSQSEMDMAKSTWANGPAETRLESGDIKKFPDTRIKIIVTAQTTARQLALGTINGMGSTTSPANQNYMDLLKWKEAVEYLLQRLRKTNQTKIWHENDRTEYIREPTTGQQTMWFTRHRQGTVQTKWWKDAPIRACYLQGDNPGSPTLPYHARLLEHLQFAPMGSIRLIRQSSPGPAHQYSDRWLSISGRQKLH